MKTRNSANNIRNFRRARAIKRLELKLQLGDVALVAQAAQAQPDAKAYRARLTDELERTKKIQTLKGGSL